MTRPLARQVLPGVTIVDLPWVNVWLIHNGPDAMMIDSGTYRDRAAIDRALSETLPQSFRLQAVIQTHGHCDHAGNAARLCRTHGAELWAHMLEEPFIAGNGCYAPGGIRTLGLSSFLFHMGDIIWPVERHPLSRTLADGDSVETPIGPLRIVHTPGHTAGHISLFDEKNGWLFSGDALITVIPVKRVSGLCLPMPVFSQDMQAAKQSARRLAELTPAALLAGHGRPWLENTARDVREFVDRAAV